jgi:peptide/nickel transport system permease protein
MPVLLWSDALIWLLVAVAVTLGRISWKNPSSRAAWRRIGANRPGMAAATVLAVFVAIALLDSLHYRPRLPDSESGQPAAYAVELLSVLDALAAPLRLRNEKTYSAPLATRAYAKETMEIPAADGSLRLLRDFPRLKYGGAHLGENEAARTADVLKKTLAALMVAVLLFAVLRGRRTKEDGEQKCRPEPDAGTDWPAPPSQEMAWNTVRGTIGVLLLVLLPILALCGDYHVFGTDKVGQDIFYQILKSVRTALVIGLTTTLVTLPLAIGLGALAGYFRGWVDDVIQYLYTTLSSIPGVLLIAAAVLMMQVVIDTHPQWFSTAAERADLRLLALCFILGLTSWTSLCRLLRGETLKLREQEYIQAAQAFGLTDFSILRRHILPNLMHLVIVALVMDFSGLVLAEAVLSYIGIGVDPTMTSFGTMINNARMELSREPPVWWSLVSAFAAMFTLVLAANLLADAVRDAFDPRQGEAKK